MRKGKNMVLTFEDATVQAAVDNGAIAQLTGGSTWTVTGTRT